MKPLTLGPTVQDLYDQDFFEWTVQNAELLRARRFDEIDVEHIAGEIEDRGKSEQRELESRLVLGFVPPVRTRDRWPMCSRNSASASERLLTSFNRHMIEKSRISSSSCISPPWRR